MIIVYHCYGGTHSSVTAAAIHLNKLSPSVDVNDLLNLPLFDRLDAADWGRLFYHGTDEFGNLIYTMGRGRHYKIIECFFQSMENTFFYKLIDDIVFIDTLPYVNIKMRIGGFLSRRLKFISLGRKLTALGTLEILPLLKEVVIRAKQVTK